MELSTPARVDGVFVHGMNRGDRMFKTVISRPLVRMAAAMCAASAVAFAIAASSDATYRGAEDALTPAAFANSSHVRIATRGNLCSAHGWPNFEPGCQFDLREPAGEARAVRAIALQ